MKSYLKTRIKQLKVDVEVYKKLEGYPGRAIDMLRARILECELALDYYINVCRK